MPFTAKESRRSLEERNQLIYEHRRIPFFVVRKMGGWLKVFRVRKEDALQVCRLGLIHAATFYEEQSEAKFSTYAIACCRGCLKGYCLQENLIRIPASLASERTRKFAAQARRVVFLGDCDTGVIDERPRGWADIPSATNPPRDFLALETLEKAFRHLDPRIAELIRMRYWQKATLEDCGRAFGITKERVRQLIARGLRKLGQYIPSSVAESLIL